MELAILTKSICANRNAVCVINKKFAYICLLDKRLYLCTTPLERWVADSYTRNNNEDFWMHL